MPAPPGPEQIDRLARRRAGAKLGWYAHAGVYVIVNLALFALSLAGGSEHYRFEQHWHGSGFRLLFWGLGLALHGLAAFALGSGSGLYERLVQRERDRLLRGRR